MDADEYKVPPHYHLVAAGLNKLSRRIQQGLLSRPQLDLRVRDFSDLEADLGNRAQPAIGGLCEALNQIGARLLVPGITPSAEEIHLLIAGLGSQIDLLLEFYHDLWRHPFPAGQQTGQCLFSAAFERPLRDLQGMFEQIEAVITDPKAAVEKYDDTVIKLEFVLRADEEFKALNEWLDGVERRQQRTANSFFGLVAGFFLGWWWGHD